MGTLNSTIFFPSLSVIIVLSPEALLTRAKDSSSGSWAKKIAQLPAVSNLFALSGARYVPNVSRVAGTVINKPN
jgi:hypothetical protein